MSIRYTDNEYQRKVIKDVIDFQDFLPRVHHTAYIRDVCGENTLGLNYSYEFLNFIAEKDPMLQKRLSDFGRTSFHEFC